MVLTKSTDDRQVYTVNLGKLERVETLKLNNTKTVNLQGISNIETRGKRDRSKYKTCEYMGKMSVIMHTERYCYIYFL